MNGRTSPGRLLVVDDERALRETLADMLRAEGWVVDEAADGVDALERMREHGYDAALVDLDMPRLGGLAVIDTVLADDRIVSPLLVVCSAIGSGGTIADAFARGADDYITKPLDVREIQARLEVGLQRRRKMTPGPQQAVDETFDVSERTSATTRCCYGCGTVLDGDSTLCMDCGRNRPTGGWPAISEREDPYLGRIIGERLRLTRRIGEGATGSVYRATDVKLGGYHAVKIVHTQGGPEADELRGRIYAEAEACARINSPHVIRVWDILTLDEDTFALVMEYAPGDDLESLAATGSLSTRDVLDIASQIATGLHAAHRLGIVHRDIKPANVIVDRSAGRSPFAYILDFGVAHTIGQWQSHEGFVGTPAYAAPEQILEKEPSAATDVYALGVVVHELLSGRRVLDGEHVADTLQRHVRHDLPRLPEDVDLEADDRRRLDRVLTQAGAKDPRERFGTAVAFGTALRDVLDHIVASSG